MPFTQDRVVRGVPRNIQPRRDTRDAQVVHDERPERPGQAAAGDLRAWLGYSDQIVSPVPFTRVALVAPHPDQQRRGTAPERLVGKIAGLRTA